MRSGSKIRKLGNKKAYDPRSYLALAETAMSGRVKRAARDPRASGKTTFAS
jgi:fructose-bisphosphate aldolase, class II